MPQILHPNQIGVASNLDSFGRLRVSEPSTQLDLKLTTGISQYVWDTEETASGTITADPGNARATLAVTGSGDSAVMASRAKAIYFPGKSNLTLCTFVMSQQAGVTKRAGLFDSLNGLFLQTDGTNFAFVGRKNGADNIITQANWNTDTMDGNGPSGITLDFSRAQILWIDCEWLGVGTVRYGFVIDGEFVLCHQKNHANTPGFVSVYMDNPNLPVCYECIGDSGAGSFDAICATVIAEGGSDNVGRQVAVSNLVLDGSSNPSNGGKVIGTGGDEIMAVRLASGHTRKGNLVPLAAAAFSSTNSNFLWQVVLNDTSPTGGSWSATGTVSEVNSGRTGSDFSTGLVLSSGYATTSQDYGGGVINSALKAGCDIAGVGDTISLRVVKIGSGNETYYGELLLLEQV